MKFKNLSTFQIRGLNQEKILNELSLSIQLFDIDRQDKMRTSFKCGYFDRKKVEKCLKTHGIEYELTNEGFCHKMQNLLTAYGLLVSIVFCLIGYFFQYQFVLKYEINGTTLLSAHEVTEFVKENSSAQKSKIDTQKLEILLVENFEEVSFASCIIKGQTLIVNIKEKLLPEQIYGNFSPIVAQNSGKITKINLISGTANVKIGDIVEKGDVLVEPYTIDTSGQVKEVEAKAEIFAEVYYQGSVDHYEKFIEIKRTGKTAIQNDITLFGLNIYQFKENFEFKMYEAEYEDIDLIDNLFLPFKIRKTTYYELSENLIETKFEDVKNQFIEKAKQKALENCENCDTIIEEFYTLRHLSGVTIVNYCLVSAEQIGGF